MPRRPRHDKKRHRARRDLTTAEWFDLAFHEYPGDLSGSPFASAEDRHRAWLAHRAELLEGDSPGSRPGAWWDYEAPGAPDRNDYRGRYDGETNAIVADLEGSLTTEEFKLDRLRYLASRGLLDDGEVKAPLEKPSAEREVEAVLDGLAERQQHLEADHSTGANDRRRGGRE